MHLLFFTRGDLNSVQGIETPAKAAIFPAPLVYLQSSVSISGVFLFDSTQSQASHLSAETQL